LQYKHLIIRLRLLFCSEMRPRPFSVDVDRTLNSLPINLKADIAIDVQFETLQKVSLLRVSSAVVRLVCRYRVHCMSQSVNQLVVTVKNFISQDRRCNLF